jgi:hypothetical protein
MAVTFYQDEHFAGQSLSSNHSVPELGFLGFNDAASSIRVTGQSATFYEDSFYRSDHWTLQSGSYDLADLNKLGIPNDELSSFIV